MKMSTFMTHCRKCRACILTSIFSSAKGYFHISRAVLSSDISSLPIRLRPLAQMLRGVAPRFGSGNQHPSYITPDLRKMFLNTSLMVLNFLLVL